MSSVRRVCLAIILLFVASTPAIAQYGPDAQPKPQEGGDNPVLGDRPMVVPDYIKPGFQMTYMGGSEIKNNAEKPGATVGMGYTVYTVLAVLEEKVYVSAVNYLTPGGLPINPDGSFDPDTEANPQLTQANTYTITQKDVNAGDAIWMPVDTLKQWQSGGKVTVQGLTRKYKGKTIQATTIAYNDGENGHSSDFHNENGMKLEYLFKETDVQRSQMQLIDDRQIDSPLIGAKWPHWAKSVKTMKYSGSYTMATPSIAPLITPLTTEVKFTERGDGYAIGKAMLKRDGTAAGSSVVVEGPGTAMGYWVHPDVLANLDEGVVIENKTIRTKTTYQVQQGKLGKLGVFVHTNSNGSFYAVNGYSLKTGALTYIQIHNTDNGVTIEFKLDDVQTD